MASIIARNDNANKPVVFLLDTLDENGSIQMWRPETDETIATDVNFYKSTHSVSDQAELDMANKYVAKFGLGEDFSIRRKLTRSAHRPINVTMTNGKEASAIVTNEPVKDAPPMEKISQPLGPERPTHVMTKTGRAIPIEDFADKIVAALSQAVKDALK